MSEDDLSHLESEYPGMSTLKVLYLLKETFEDIPIMDDDELDIYKMILRRIAFEEICEKHNLDFKEI